MSFEARIRTCHLCLRARGGKGAMNCPADGGEVAQHAESGECPLKLFDEPGIIQIAARGAAGIIKALAGQGGASERVVEHRTAVCGRCPHAVTRLGIVQQCQLCGCSIWSKVRNAKERCPDARWEAAGNVVAFVNLGRAGDILALLPYEKYLHDSGRKVLHVVCREWLPIVAGISYVDPVVYDGPHMYDQRGAIQFAGTLADEILATRPPGQPELHNYLLDQWRAVGAENLFDKLPMVLDNRDPDAERKIVEQFVSPGDDRPLLLVNTEGFTSKYVRDPTFIPWVRATWGERANVADLTGFRAPRLVDLLGLFERAAVLLTIDTATLHLGYATRTPTIALVNDTAYSASPRQLHWIERMSYAESRTQEGKERIAAAIESRLVKMTM